MVTVHLFVLTFNNGFNHFYIAGALIVLAAVASIFPSIFWYMVYGVFVTFCLLMLAIYDTQLPIHHYREITFLALGSYTLLGFMFISLIQKNILAVEIERRR